AQKAGIQVGDVIVELNGQPVTGSQDLINRVASTPVGQTVNLGYLRDVNGKMEPRKVSIAVGERPLRGASEAAPTPTPKAPATKRTSAEIDKPKLGLTLSELTPQLAGERNLRGVRGLLVKDVDPSGIANEANVRENMVIQRVNRTPINTIEDFERVINSLKPGDAVVLNVAYSIGDEIRTAIVQFTYQ
ncbi:MAG: PDZ domain-containing protein, partial [Acidobacteria bacterium]|nr:PDZ domain-containing protein [Acidobacteriota bacterium]